MRTERPIKALRRQAVDEGENDDARRVPGASGSEAGNLRRPGRSAALPSTAPRARSATRRRSAGSTHASTPRANLSRSSRGAGKKSHR